MGNDTTRFEKQRGKLKFDGTISLGNILSFIILLVGILTFSYGMDKRVSMLENSVMVAKEDRTAMWLAMKQMAESMQKMAVSQERLSTLIERRN